MCNRFEKSSRKHLSRINAFFTFLVKMKILYFTSTGNNLYIAQNLGEELLSIPQLVNDNILDIKDDVVGIVFPVYYATSPKMLREYLKKVNITTDYLFLIASYGSDGDQNALRIMTKTLEKRGMAVNYTNSVLVVDNYLPMFDMAKEKEIKDENDILNAINIIKDDILMKKEFKLSKKMFTNVPFIEKVLESTMSKKFKIVVGKDCSNCQICTKVCPRGNIELTEEKPVLGDNCEFCLGCVHHCKNNVLNLNQEANPDERYINPNIKVSEIMKSNNIK